MAQADWNMPVAGGRVCKPCLRESGAFILYEDILFGDGGGAGYKIMFSNA